MNTLYKLVYLGVSKDLPLEEQIKTKLTNAIIVILIIGCIISLSAFYLIDVSIFEFGWKMFMIPISFYVVVLILSHNNHIIIARHLFMVIANSAIFYFSLLLGNGLGVELFFVIMICISFLIMPTSQKFFPFLYSGISLLLIIIGHFDWPALILELNDKARFHMATFNSCAAIIAIFILIKLFNDSFLKNSRVIEEQNIELKRLVTENKDLEHFAYIASHDLSEPIRTINSFIEIIKEEYHDPNNQELNEYFQFIDTSSKRMRNMIHGIANYTKLGREKNFEPCNLNETITNLEQDLAQIISEYSAIVKKSQLPTIKCNATGIQQVFQNLMVNAIKFQHSNTPPVIEITYQEKPDHWEFCVKDNGIGIHENKQEAVFQMFTKLHRPTEFKGHGIGLAFCKKIIELHQGNIWIESTLNVGSKFYFSISKEL